MVLAHRLSELKSELMTKKGMLVKLSKELKELQ